MKKLLVLALSSTALLTACGGSNGANVKVLDGSSNVITIGGASFNKQDTYEMLSTQGGDRFILDAFKEAIVLDPKNYADGKAAITTRIDFLYNDYVMRTAPHIDILEAINASGYAGVADYKARFIRLSAIEELFNEIYVEDNKETLFLEHLPRKAWQIKNNDIDAAEATASVLAGDITQFDEQAAYNWASMFDTTIANAAKSYTGNTDRTLGLQGISHTDWMTTATIETADEVGYVGYILENTSNFTSEIRNDIFDEDFVECDDDDVTAKAAGTDYSCLTTDGLLEIDGYTFHNESKESFYIVKIELPTAVGFDDTLAAREIGKVSSIATKAQNEIFKSYNLEAWDQTIYDAISDTILDNK